MAALELCKGLCGNSWEPGGPEERPRWEQGWGGGTGTPGKGRLGLEGPATGLAVAELKMTDQKRNKTIRSENKKRIAFPFIFKLHVPCI